MASANETPAGASTTTAFDGLLPLTPLLSASHVNLEHVFYSYAKYPDLMNMTKETQQWYQRARFREETGSGKENRKKNPRPKSFRIRENPRPKSERGKKGKKKERRVETLTLTLVSHSDERKRKEIESTENRIGKKIEP